MPDFIFPFFPDLIRKHIIQSVSKKLLEKLYVKNLGKNMRLKLMFSAVTIIDCFWKSFHFSTMNNKLKKCCMQTALRVSSFPFSLCCGNNFEGGTFESPFSSAILYFKGYGKGWKWNYRLAMKIDDFSPLLNCWVCGLAWNSKFDILDGKSGIYMFDGID